MSRATRSSVASAPSRRPCTFSPLLVAPGDEERWAVGRSCPDLALPPVEALAPLEAPETRALLPEVAHRAVPPEGPATGCPTGGPSASAPSTGESPAPVPSPRRPEPAATAPAAEPDGGPRPFGAPGTREQRRDPELRRAFGALLRDLTGSEILTQQAVTLLRSVVDRSTAGSGTAPDEDAVAATALLEDLGRDLAAAQARLEEAEAAHQEEQLERALAEQARLEAERRLRELQRRVQRSGVEIDAWSTAPADEDEAVPATTAELLERLAAGRLARVVFTGDPARALELDDVVHTGLHVQRTWEALLALRDYAAAKADGSVDSDVQGYLERTPDGMCSWPAGRHARGESSTVQNDPRLRAPRLLPVPVEVDPSGRAPMWAHMKLLSLGQTSPRLHYLDDTRRTGRVYVGYVGRHLPNTQTS
ncbi:hypothetical protein [uncultured Pseudokineococcus sp.]|uniref:hypothetical protein n=1 Tax=uncultured Pseudokineococcus sp. TaxID=1642928 RepID=UPI00262EAC26|nr:hypothetical protein [uncultured Pseudokineococcus sp.]